MKYAKDFQVWDLGFATSSDSEDNDTDEDLVELRDKQFEAIKDKEKLTYQTYMSEIAEKKKIKEK